MNSTILRNLLFLGLLLLTAQNVFSLYWGWSDARNDMCADICNNGWVPTNPGVHDYLCIGSPFACDGYGGQIDWVTANGTGLCAAYYNDNSQFCTGNIILSEWSDGLWAPPWSIDCSGGSSTGWQCAHQSCPFGICFCDAWQLTCTKNCGYLTLFDTRNATATVNCSSCTNECSSGTNSCAGDARITCGNYDADPCLEWGNFTNCGADEIGPWSGNICYNGDVQQSRTLTDRYCSGGSCGVNTSTEYRLIDDCTASEVCSSGTCVASCTANSYSACYNNDRYWYNSCNVRGSLRQDCGDDSYGAWGSNFCQSNDVYHSRTFYDRGCNSDACFNTTSTDTQRVQDCGEDSCGAWSANFCQDGDVVRTRTCNDRGCASNACFNTSSTETQVIDDCIAGEKCSSATCVPNTTTVTFTVSALPKTVSTPNNITGENSFTISSIPFSKTGLSASVTKLDATTSYTYTYTLS